MYVVKRDGRKESVKFDKVTARIQKLAYGLSEHVETFSVAQKVIEGIYLTMPCSLHGLLSATCIRIQRSRLAKR
jgi:hypothetical protein